MADAPHLAGVAKRRRAMSGVLSRAPRRSERLATLVIVVSTFALASCAKSAEGTYASSHDAGSDAFDARMDADTSADAGDAFVPFDASSYPCYPVSYEYILQGATGLSLDVGTSLSCDGFGFVATAAEQTAAEAQGGTCTMHAADEYWCTIAVPSSWIVAGSDYDEICSVESALGPRRWICIYVD